MLVRLVGASRFATRSVAGHRRGLLTCCAVNKNFETSSFRCDVAAPPQKPVIWSATQREISSDLRAKLLQEKDEYSVSRSSKLRPERAERVLEQFQSVGDLEDRDEALTVLTLFFQQGATARSADGNMQVSIFGKTFTLAQVRRCLKDASFAKGERKLARSFANEIQEIASVLEVPGNLYNKIQKKDLQREFTMEEKTWLSDFQSDNENCPTELRQLILDAFKKKPTRV